MYLTSTSESYFIEHCEHQRLKPGYYICYILLTCHVVVWEGNGSSLLYTVHRPILLDKYGVLLGFSQSYHDRPL